MTASVIALKCPVCGAPFTPESDRCTFCGSILVLKTDHPRIDPRLLNKAVIDEHITEYRRTLRSEPSDETAHYGLGVAYFNLGLIEDSIRELTHAAQLMPENTNIQTQLAVALREAVRRGDQDAKRQMDYRIDTALHLDPNNMEALLLQADVLTEVGNRGAAVEYLERAYTLDKSNVRDKLLDTLTSLAHEQEKAEEWGALTATWKKLGEIDPQKARREFARFINENRNVPPPGGSSTTRWFLLTIGIGGLLVRIATVQAGSGSWVAALAVLAWLAALVIVPIWASKRAATGDEFGKSQLLEIADGKHDFTTTGAAARQVVRWKAEQKQRREAELRKSQERAQAKVGHEGRAKRKSE